MSKLERFVYAGIPALAFVLIFQSHCVAKDLKPEIVKEIYLHRLHESDLKFPQTADLLAEVFERIGEQASASAVATGTDSMGNKILTADLERFLQTTYDDIAKVLDQLQSKGRTEWEIFFWGDRDDSNGTFEVLLAEAANGNQGIEKTKFATLEGYKEVWKAFATAFREIAALERQAQIDRYNENLNKYNRYMQSNQNNLQGKRNKNCLLIRLLQL